jgi:hypothetical protein
MKACNAAKHSIFEITPKNKTTKIATLKQNQAAAQKITQNKYNHPIPSNPQHPTTRALHFNLLQGLGGNFIVNFLGLVVDANSLKVENRQINMI